MLKWNEAKNIKIEILHLKKLILKEERKISFHLILCSPLEISKFLTKEILEISKILRKFLSLGCKYITILKEIIDKDFKDKYFNVKNIELYDSSLNNLKEMFILFDKEIFDNFFEEAKELSRMYDILCYNALTIETIIGSLIP